MADESLPAGPLEASPFIVASRAFSAPAGAALLAQAEAFGEVLGTSSDGLPVVEHSVTGEVRPLTPVEADFPVHLPYVRTGVRDVVWSPGPHGWGLWWNPDQYGSLLSDSTSLDRTGWRQQQERELRYAVRVLASLLEHLLVFDFDVWVPHQSDLLVQGTEGLAARYPSVVSLDSWDAIPLSWSCDPFVDSTYKLGVSLGCPSGDLEQRLSTVWNQVGVVHGQLSRFGRIGVRVDDVPTEVVYSSTVLRDLAFLFEDLRRDARDLQILLEALRVASWEEDLPIDVELFQLPAGS